MVQTRFSSTRLQPGDKITWRVTHTIAGVAGRTDFGEDSSAAEEFFWANVRGMEESPVINDRAAIYRIKKIAYGYGLPEEQKTIVTYQDAYKFAIMSPHGVIFRYAPYSPQTWQDAERITKKLRQQRRK